MPAQFRKVEGYVKPPLIQKNVPRSRSRLPALHVAGHSKLQGLAAELGDFTLAGGGAGQKEKAPADRSPERLKRLSQRSELVANLIGPEALEPDQGLVERLQIAGGDATDLLQGFELAVVEAIQHLAHL